MSWQDAISGARRWIQRSGLPPSLKGATILLSLYEDESTYNFLRPGEAWSFDFHRMVMRASARELKSRGARVQFVEINLPAYWDFLAQYNLENTDANRAQFIAWKTAPDPKPSPLTPRP